MINLLPTDKKQATAYARRNTATIKWLTGVGLALVGIVVVTGGSLFYLRQDSSVLKKSIEESKASLTAQNEEATLKRAQEMSGNLKLAVDVLSNEVLFSKLLQRIGLVMPSGTVLQSLSLTSDIASNGISLEIGASDYESGSRAHANLNDANNGIFEKADIEDITCSAEPEAAPYYCLVTVRALFAKDNPFMLISEDN